MTSDAFRAMNTVAELRSKGVRFTATGPEIPGHLAGGERLLVQRQIEELTEMLSGPEAWAAVAGLDTTFLEGLWDRLDEDGASVLQDDSCERIDGVFYGWAAEHLGPVDIGV